MYRIETYHTRRPSIKGCCQRGDHARRSKPKPQPLKPLTEPCHICLNVVGLEAECGFIENWAVLPCGHKFGAHCLKTWLGLKESPSCPICKVPMVHICGHPPMPRYTTPPEYDPTDIQPGEDRVPGTLKSNLKAEGLDAQPEAQAHFIEEAAAAQNEKAEPNEQAVQDEGAECGPAVSEKNVQVAAQRVSSSSSDAHPSRPIESVSNNGNDNDNGNIEAPQVSNNEQPVVVALPSQQEPAAEPVAELVAQSQPAQLPWVDHPRRFTTVFVYDPNNQPLRRPRREFRWRLPRTNAPPPVIQHLPVVVEKRRPRPIGYNTTEDYDVLAGMMDKGKVPSEVPKYMNMAFPRTVDLSVPCAYCFMKLDCTIQDAGEHIRGPPKISKGTTSRIPGKRYAVLGAKYFFAYSYYAISTALYAVTTGLDDCMSGKGELTDQEEERLDAYIDAMNETRSRSFHQWWSMQLPVTLPAVLAPGADGLYYSDGYYR